MSSFQAGAFIQPEWWYCKRCPFWSYSKKAVDQHIKEEHMKKTKTKDDDEEKPIKADQIVKDSLKLVPGLSPLGQDDD